MVIIKYKPRVTRTKSFNTSTKNVIKGTTPATDEDYLTQSTQERSVVDNFSSTDEFVQK